MFRLFCAVGGGGEGTRLALLENVREGAVTAIYAETAVGMRRCRLTEGARRTLGMEISVLQKREEGDASFRCVASAAILRCKLAVQAQYVCSSVS